MATIAETITDELNTLSIEVSTTGLNKLLVDSGLDGSENYTKEHQADVDGVLIPYWGAHSEDAGCVGGGSVDQV